MWLCGTEVVLLVRSGNGWYVPLVVLKCVFLYAAQHKTTCKEVYVLFNFRRGTCGRGYSMGVCMCTVHTCI